MNVGRVLLLTLLMPFLLQSQKAETQISFAKEQKPLAYYVEQAALWWKEVEQDRGSEKAWWNYYRACRNAQGKADWSTDFVNLGPNLRPGDEIVEMMEESIPGTFIYHYTKGSTGGAAADAGSHLMKAYAMKPDFPGMLANVVTYASATHDDSLRKEANARWYKQGEWSPAFLAFARNLLMSVNQNGILLTQHDNDTYPLWLVQDAEGFRQDVLVLNIDFLLNGDFSDSVFTLLGIPKYRIGDVDVNEYRSNWKNVVMHLLREYQGERPLYVSQTLSPDWYAESADEFTIHGLAKHWKSDIRQKSAENARLLASFDWNYIDLEFPPGSAEERLLEMDLLYLPAIELALLGTSLNQNERNQLEFIGRTIISELGDDALWDDYPFIPQKAR